MSIDRSAGILLPISSLPSNYGIGTLGKEAYNFVDFLEKSKMKYWQILPIGPTSYGDSPYQSFSSCACNPYFIDLDILVEEGLLEKEDLEDLKEFNPAYVEYWYIYETRFDILRKAYKRGFQKDKKPFKAYYQENKSWLEDYSLYMAVKNHFGMVSWLDWPDEEIRLRKKEALVKYRELLKDDIQYYQYLQYLFYKQYSRLRKYAHSKNVKIIGDLPIYVALDSADVWANPKQFQLDRKNVPLEVAGVPPDYFSEDGQLWGNPLYDWDVMKKDDYKFWKERVEGNSKYYDVIRIDHFRGFESYWAVPYGDKTARNGRWVKGPDMDFVSVLRDWFSNVEFIAEDLGVISDEVNEMLAKSTFPGMRVLEFGMDPKGASYHTPFNHIENCVCYISTHDNSPIMGWRDNASKADVKHAIRYFNLTKKEGFNWGFIRGGMNSVAKLFIAQMQDYLGLGEETRTNCPGTIGDNWKWRLVKDQLTDELAEKIAGLVKMYGRD
ncbi:MAG: 4-alpha-glucanotransferase [Bacillota bacterium]|jgi:4-alpha-glucanotransferase|nr:4-alpha-glucanotransferase [Bacillota bacterium]NLL27022.1 4-alpha-glucanotransferase [Erysipelotrichia bacterium]